MLRLLQRCTVLLLIQFVLITNNFGQTPFYSNSLGFKSWFGGFTFDINVLSISIVLLIVLPIAYLLFIFPTFNKLKRKLNRYDNRLNELNINTSIPDIRYDVTKLKADLISIRQELDNLNNFEKNNKQSSASKIKKVDVNRIFYLSSSNKDGNFLESTTHPFYREGASVYKFTLDLGNTKATFHVDKKEASIKMAMQYPEIILDPLCDSENMFHPKKTNITTIYPGKVELRENKWVLVQKASIRYED